ncbi:MBL fold metallo-hydrolase [Halomonas sp. H10-9-1]|uniref:MBL fold metallo-hydrolase n=1 Tax=Halomonas sp. H10-9-1 TaxID=2950871 RepID=UPI0032DF3D24
MNPYPQLLHHGGATGVTGSCHRLQISDDRALLVDCGLFQGQDADHVDSFEQYKVNFPVDDVLALVVTHVHIDHIGRLPYLLAAGYRGPILCSVPSARLLPLVIEDALKIGFTRDRALIERFLAEVEGRLAALGYREWHTLVDDDRHRVRVRLQRAGHILGSCYVEVDTLDRESGKVHRTLFSGDLGAPYAPLLPAPKPPWGCDTLVLESTYGDRRHEGRRHRRARLKAAIERLTDVIEEWESIAPDFAKFNAGVETLDAVDMLKFLMEQHGLGIADFPEIGSKSLVSRILNRRGRELTRRHIQALSKRFGVSPALFFG